MSIFIRMMKRHRGLGILIFAALVLGMLAIIRFLPESDLLGVSGYASVIDGDSLRVQGIEIRLRGIDAPEGKQFCTRAGVKWPCGEQAARKLRNLLRGKIVSCKGNERDIYDRQLSRCTVDGIEINSWLIEQGLAVSYYDYSDEESSARRAKRGIWSGTFIRPQDWRYGKR